MPDPAQRLPRGIYAITGCDLLEFAEVRRKTAEILRAGVSALQYRDKLCGAAERRVRARVLLEMCRASRTPLLVNDDPDLGAEVGADGVHLGADDPPLEATRRMLGPAAIIGISCYADVERALWAARHGADYLALGAFFPTTTKTPRAAATLDILRQVRGQVSLPVVAIGGITPENSMPLIEAGADLLAVISSIYGVSDPAHQIARFRAQFDKSAGVPR